jgi:hypothetical protein
MPVAFLPTSKKFIEKEIMNTTISYNSYKKIRYLGINLTKKMKDLYDKNDKTLMK